MKLRLEDLVTSVATELMGVTVSTLQAASTHLLNQLVHYFEVDLSFLRRNDHRLAPRCWWPSGRRGPIFHRRIRWA